MPPIAPADAPLKLDVAQLLPAGSTFGPYLVERPIGAGAYGVVYRVHKGRLRRARALKVLRAEHAHDPLLVARFEREARALAAIRDENVVEVEDVGTLDGRHFIEMELLEGRPLTHALRERPRWSLEEALDVILPVAAGLHAAHTSPMHLVHRDLRPDNIFLAVSPGGAVVPKLIDFGVAHASGEELTATGQRLGAPNYMAPEQVRGASPIDGRADQWALAVVLFQMLTGRRPFAMPNAIEVGVCILHAPTPALCDDGVAIDPAAEGVMRTALSKQAVDRFASMREFGLALAPFARAATRARFEARWGATELPEETTRLLGAAPPRRDAVTTPAPPEVEASAPPQEPSATSPMLLPAPPALLASLDDPFRPAVRSALPAVVITCAEPTTIQVDGALASRARRRVVVGGAATLLTAAVTALLAATWMGPRETRPAPPPTPNAARPVAPLVTSPPVTDPRASGDDAGAGDTAVPATAAPPSVSDAGPPPRRSRAAPPAGRASPPRVRLLPLAPDPYGPAR